MHTPRPQNITNIPHTRRDFIQFASAASIGFLGMHRFLGQAHASNAARHDLYTRGFGPLVPDPRKILDLPPGFAYRIISRKGQEMADGLLVPGVPDGMAAFEASGGLTVLVRNHEINNRDTSNSPFGPKNERLGRINPDRIYDEGVRGVPALGCTTNIVYDTREQRVVRQFLSSAGHCRNCAGGATPWGTWLTCEETVIRSGELDAAEDHGYVFEVPATHEPSLADPTPIRAMGRFNHEAVCIDPRTGIAYLTEDRDDGLFYRFIPVTPGSFQGGGRLEALAIRGEPGADTRNWAKPHTPTGEARPVEWIALEDTDPRQDDLRHRGHRSGAALFARGEGIHWAHDSAYVVCTNGGEAKKGQVWRYLPSPHEGQTNEADRPGTISLFVEPNDADVIDMPDNIGVAPWGDLILCEDGSGEQFLVGVTPEGRLYKFARNAANSSEFAGACFSPDGSTMFVNIQYTALTLAITGPWRRD